MFLNTLVHKLHQSIFRYPEVISYLSSRKVIEEDINKYELGYSRIVNAIGDNSADWIRFVDECWRGKKLESKIIFPIRDQLGKIAGLSGRSVETKEFKNFITNEAKHNGFFFGLHQALPHIYEKNYAFVVEGFFDVIALSKVFPNTVGSLTAGIMDSQFDLLSMYCDTVIVIFDTDKAGNAAAERAEKRKGVYSLSLGYKDPARCLEYWGEEKFKKFMRKKLTNLPGGILWGDG